MPEIKNAFIKGKMNKDLDERLIPNGEYRDAVNIDVDFSEGSDVGALKSILGNTQRDTISLSNAKCIGTVKDIENNKIYWFITSSAKDLIAEWDYQANTYDTIIVDQSNILNFNTANFITGANVIDGILFFTDNLNEPRQIDIEYWRGQTSGSAGTSSGLSAERITVIKKSPLAAPTLEMNSSARGGNGTAGNTGIFIDANLGTSTSAGNLGTPRDSGYQISSSQQGISKFKVAGGAATNPNYQANDVVILTHKFTESDNTVKTIKVRIKLASNYTQGSGSNVGVFSNAEILTISEKVPLEAVLWTCILEEEEPLFQEKFPRFAYRYKYNNGQYSCFSPFSNAAFLPDPTVGGLIDESNPSLGNTGIEYDVKAGSNLAMVNSLRSLKLKDLNHNIHADVEEIDILYKDSVGTNCYLVDTIKRNTSNAFPSPLEFEVKDDQIFKTLPSNQLLRLFDSVPRKAKAQEITANRLIYGNYTENFNLKDSSNPPANVEPVFSVGIHNRYNPTDSNYDDVKKERQSIKSKRTYQFGVVYMDEFGRQTPVLTSKTGIVKVGQEGASFSTRFKAAITSNPPSFAKTYKYFIKEISSKTHNFIGDSFYQDKEGFIYVAIPSADVNKVDIDDKIVLKKKRGNDISNITEEFKVLDKYTTPPPFLAKPLKEIYVPDVFVFGKNLEQDRDLHILKPGSSPVPGRNRITISAMYKFQDTNIQSGSEIESDTADGVSVQAYSKLNPGAKVKFVTGSGDTDVYTISNKEIDLADDNDFELHFTQEFGDDVKILYDNYEQDKLFNSSGAANGATIVGGDISLNVKSNSYGGGVKMVIVDTVDESGKEEYQGKFFIKIKNNTNLLAELKGEEDLNNLQVLSTISLDGNQTDNDPRQFHMYGGGLANKNSSTTRNGGSEATTPMNGGFDGAYNHITNTQHPSFNIGQSYLAAKGFITNSELNQGYHFAIRTDNPYSDRNSKYATLPLISGLEKSPSNKNNYNTDNPVYLKFDRSRTQITAGQAADNNLYKIERVYKYLERGGTPASDFDDGDAVYLIKLDKNLAQNLVFNGQIETEGDPGNEANIMHISVLEFRKEDQLIGIPEPPIFEVLPKDDVDIDIYYETQEVFTIASDGTNNHGNANVLSYYNCFCFLNGVESMSIRDTFNGAPLGKGVRVSTVFEDKPYVEENHKNNLIFSQIYNNKNGLNRLNQFIIAEAITKEINPDYGSIQLLHTRYNDIIAYCENKVVKILTNKDALFNADGNVNVTSNKAVLGQAIPYNSNYGISKNPESFAFYTHRSYFTDRKNGVVVRHSMDGMEAISDYGMKDFFRDALPANTGYMVGSYDIRKHQYNISTHTSNANSTISFSESVKGWTSKKSFIPEAGESIQNKYFTFKNGHIFEHHVGSVCNFYGSKVTPYVELILNESPANMKNFRTLNYEGDDGWTCPSVVTDQQNGAVDTFINKENKYFNYIRGKGETTATIDFKALNTQGIGIYSSVTGNSGNTITYVFENNVPNDLQVGDTLYYLYPFTNVVTAIGSATIVTSNSVTAGYSTVPPISGSFSPYFVFYVKNSKWETSGLLGYFATVKMQNAGSTSKEIYAVGSEISISS
jgi:hypothetical protein